MPPQRVAGNPLVRPLTKLIEQTMTVADLVAEPLFSLEAELSSMDGASVLEARGFDLAGVSTDGVVKDFVELSDLKGSAATVGASARPILAADCVERSLPVSQLFDRLLEDEHVFVLDGAHVRWVVTRSDLQAPAVSVVVLAYVGILEAGFRQLAGGLSEERRC